MTVSNFFDEVAVGDNQNNGSPLVRHRGRWAAAALALTAVAVGSWVYLSGVRVADVTATAKKWWASVALQVKDFRDGPPERQVEATLDIAEGTDELEDAYGSIRVASAKLMQEQFPRNAETVLPQATDTDCLISAQLFIENPLPGRTIAATYLIGLPDGGSGLVGAPEVLPNGAKRGAAQIVNLAGIGKGEFEVAVRVERNSGHPITTEKVTLEVTDKVVLDGRELDCTVTKEMSLS